MISAHIANKQHLLEAYHEEAVGKFSLVCKNNFVLSHVFYGFVYYFRVVVLESRPTDNPTANSNLYILAGHENSY